MLDLAQNSFLVKWPDWLRWLLFLPCAILLSVLFSTLWIILYSLFIAGDPGFLVKVGQSAILGGSFVWIGSYVSPKHQFQVSIVLLILISMFSTVSYFLNLVTNTTSSFEYIVNAIGVLIGAGTIVYTIHEEEVSHVSNS